MALPNAKVFNPFIHNYHLPYKEGTANPRSPERTLQHQLSMSLRSAMHCSTRPCILPLVVSSIGYQLLSICSPCSTWRHKLRLCNVAFNESDITGALEFLVLTLINLNPFGVYLHTDIFVHFCAPSFRKPSSESHPVWSPQSDAMDRNCCSLLVRVGTRDH